ncbi:MAG: hypothetical protein ABFS35_07975 [Bacteroidota bacterium]
MKQALLILGIFFMGMYAKAQTVENIHTEQVGEKINIYYQIKNSGDDQIFHVTISCLINNSKKIILKSITGDVGDNIIGGKEGYKAIWDVLQDVDELTNAEFFVKIELIDDGTIINPVKSTEEFNPAKYKKENKGQFFVAAQTLGIKLGYMGKLGFAVSAGFDIIDLEFTLLGSVSKSIIKKQNFQWNIYPIIGIHNTYYYDEYDEDYYIGLAFGAGTDVAIGHLYINFDNFLDTESWYHIMAGIGWRF